MEIKTHRDNIKIDASILPHAYQTNDVKTTIIACNTAVTQCYMHAYVYTKVIVNIENPR